MIENTEVEPIATSTGLQALQEADSKHQTDVHEVQLSSSFFWLKLYVWLCKMNGILYHYHNAYLRYMMNLRYTVHQDTIYNI